MSEANIPSHPARARSSLRRLAGTLFFLPLALAAESAMAAPASSADRLQCALDLVPPEAQRNFTRLYEAQKSRADLDGVIAEPVYDQMVEACLDPAPADLERRAGRLGQAIMSWQLRRVAEDSLSRHHAVSTLALEEAWKGLGTAERTQLTGQDPNAIILRLSGRLRPDLVGAAAPDARNSAAADKAYLDLIEDVAVYASSRALLEAVAGSY